MHSFSQKMLSLSFHTTWIQNRERQPEKVVRTADQRLIPYLNIIMQHLKDCHYLISQLSGMLLALKKKTIIDSLWTWKICKRAPFICATVITLPPPPPKKKISWQICVGNLNYSFIWYCTPWGIVISVLLWSEPVPLI